MTLRLRTLLLSTAFPLLFCLSVPTLAADQTEVAVSALEFGGSLGKLLWVSVRDAQQMSVTYADRYVELAKRVRAQIDEGRASSALVGANFNVLATTLGYAAAVDPEPLSKAVSGVAVWGAKKTGDAIGQTVLAAAEVQARAVLAEGLKGISPAELQSMTPDQLRARVADLQIGGIKLREALQDIPGALPMLEAQSVDLATQTGVEALAKADGIGADVGAVKTALAKATADLADYQKTVNDHLSRLEGGLTQLKTDAASASLKVDALKDAVQGNATMLKSLASISYSGWSTSQKLQAVESGLFPELTGPAKDAIVGSLQAQLKVEATIQTLQTSAQVLGTSRRLLRT
jgi:hypothetical protein